MTSTQIPDLGSGTRTGEPGRSAPRSEVEATYRYCALSPTLLLLARRIGIIPDLGRGSAFAVIFVMSALQTLARAVATALLAVTSGSWLLCYIVTDHGVHLIYRVYRRDVIFLIPTPPAAAYITSPLFRVIQKAIVDFTGTLQFRLPLILGGSYWLFSLIMSQASVFVCVHLYNEYAALPDGVNKVDAGTLWAGAEGLAVAWLLAFTYERTSDAKRAQRKRESRGQTARANSKRAQRRRQSQKRPQRCC
jgi:hypothetical protein